MTENPTAQNCLRLVTGDFSRLLRARLPETIIGNYRERTSKMINSLPTYSIYPAKRDFGDSPAKLCVFQYSQLTSILFHFLGFRSGC